VFSNKEASDMDVMSAVGGFVTADDVCRVGLTNNDALFSPPPVTDDGN